MNRRIFQAYCTFAFLANFLFLASAFAYSDIYSAAAPSASEASLLETLASKGIITEEERANLAKEMASAVYLQTKTQCALTMSLRTQFIYELVNSSPLSDPQLPDTTTNSFEFRRVFICFKTDETKNWGAQLYIDLVMRGYVSLTYIWFNVDCEYLTGRAEFGYKKPNFIYEQNMLGFNLFAIERSVATSYWGYSFSRTKGTLGFGSFTTGAYWNGKVRQIEGLYYNVALTNPTNFDLYYDNTKYPDGASVPIAWASLSYRNKIFDKGQIDAGVNFGYGANSNLSGAYAKNTASEIIGVNPYIYYENPDFRVLGEFMASGVSDGKVADNHAACAVPIGLNAAFEYYFECGDLGKIAPVFRYSWIDSDKRGISPDLERNCKLNSGDTPYNAAQSFYLGLNWYLRGNDLKVQFGYEFAQFSGNASGAEKSHVLNANAFRTQFQMIF